MSDPDSDLAQLQRFAPILSLHPDEQNLPSSIDWYASRCNLFDADGRPITQGGACPADLEDRAPGQHVGYYLSPMDAGTTYPGQPIAELSTVPCYGFVRRLHDAQGNLVNRDLVYWFFYPYNGNVFNLGALAGFLTGGNLLVAGISSIFLLPMFSLPLIALAATGSIAKLAEAAGGMGMHEGDWEEVTIRLDASNRFVKMHLSAHGKGTWVTSGDVTWGDDGTRPYVFVAKASHANYAAPGTYVRLGGLASDVCAFDQGSVWDTKTTVVDIGWYDGLLTQSVPAWTALAGALPMGNPSIAVNNNRLWIAAGYGTQPDQSTYLNVGSSVPYCLTMNTPMPPWIATATVTPGVSINDSGVFIAAVQEGSDQLYAIAGAMDSIDHANVEIWTQSLVRYDPGATSGPAAIALSNAVGGTKNVWVAAHRYQNQYFWDAGSIDDATKSIVCWGSNTRIDVGISEPAIAINDHGVVISVHSAVPNGSNQSALFYNIGTIDVTTQSIQWTGGTNFGVGELPSIALTNSGTVFCSYLLNDNVMYRTGQLQPLTGKIVWAGTTGSQLSYNLGVSARGAGTSCALLEDGTTFVCFWSASTRVGSNPCTIVEGKLSGDLSQWNPPAGAAWTTYSGRWGKPGDVTLLSLGKEELAPTTNGPEGPVQRPDYFFGP
ncbi:MAG: Vps62-related protein [Deltaproteobacteria bacterium]|nr:Vps62-related protein [Deltaproteobacteria bacterium]